MVKITGTLHIDTGFVRLKPNINFIGAKLGLSIYDLSKPLEIELDPTPAEGLYLVDYTPDINSGFSPTEHWSIPNENCTFDGVRGVSKAPLDYVESLEGKIRGLEEKIRSLEEEIENLRAEKMKHIEEDIPGKVTSQNQTPFDILKRFS